MLRLRPSTYGRIVIAGLLLSLAVGAGTPEPAKDPTPDELVSTFRLPLVDGRVEFNRFVENLGRHLDVNTRLFLLQWARLPGQNRTVEPKSLARLQEVTGGVVTVSTASNELTVRIDHLRMRRHQREFQTRLGEQLRGWFPDEARKVRAQYVMALHKPGESAQPVGQEAPPNQVVVLVHGLDDPGGLWEDLIPQLNAAGLTAAEISYPNDQGIARSASFVAEQLAALRKQGVLQVSIVAHSMGGLVSRDILTRKSLYGGKANGYAAGPVVDRLIMVGTPNHGSEMARLQVVSELRDQLTRAFSGDGMLFGSVFDGAGEAQEDLLPGSDFLRDLNARPAPVGVRYTIVAGKASPVDAGAVQKLSDLLPGQPPEAVQRLGKALDSLANGVGDGCVTLASAQLRGVSDFHVVGGNHISMIRRALPVGDLPPAVPIIVKTLQSP